MSDMFFESRPERMPLGKLVTWAGVATQGYYRRTVAQHGVTGTAVSVLGALAHLGDGISQRELAGRVGLTPATLTPVLDTLEQEGRISRERGRQDRRIVLVSLTASGRKHLESVFTEVAATFRERMPKPTPDQEEIIRNYLVALLATVGQDSRCAGDGGGPPEGGER